MVYERFERIKQHIGISSNAKLAEILNTKVTRIKTLSSEKLAIKKFKDSEIEIFSKKFSISELWLVNGEGEFLKSGSTKDLLISEINQMSNDRAEFYYHLICAERLKTCLSY